MDRKSFLPNIPAPASVSSESKEVRLERGISAVAWLWLAFAAQFYSLPLMAPWRVSTVVIRCGCPYRVDLSSLVGLAFLLASLKNLGWARKFGPPGKIACDYLHNCWGKHYSIYNRVAIGKYLMAKNSCFRFVLLGTKAQRPIMANIKQPHVTIPSPRVHIVIEYVTLWKSGFGHPRHCIIYIIRF